jgi:hypothetical protein
MWIRDGAARATRAHNFPGHCWLGSHAHQAHVCGTFLLHHTLAPRSRPFPSLFCEPPPSTQRAYRVSSRHWGAQGGVRDAPQHPVSFSSRAEPGSAERTPFSPSAHHRWPRRFLWVQPPTRGAGMLSAPRVYASPRRAATPGGSTRVPPLLHSSCNMLPSPFTLPSKEARGRNVPTRAVAPCNKVTRPAEEAACSLMEYTLP